MNKNLQFEGLGARKPINFFWASFTLLGSLGVLFISASSFYGRNFFSFNSSEFVVPFLPQGATLTFYGIAGLFVSFHWWILIFWNVGSGYNLYDTDQEIEFQLFAETYQLVEPSIKEKDAVYESITYSSELYISAGLIWKNSRDIQEQIIFLGNIPLMNSLARVEWLREGRVPLQTIRAKIDYCSYPVRTIYGVLGIKVWIFLNKE